MCAIEAGRAAAVLPSLNAPRVPARKSSSPVEAAATSPTSTAARKISSPRIPTSQNPRSPATRPPTSSLSSKSTASPGTKRSSASSSATAPPATSSTCCSPKRPKPESPSSAIQHHRSPARDAFHVLTDHAELLAPALVVATGGLSIPKMGATSFGYDLARQFNLNIVEPPPALAPFVLAPANHSASAISPGSQPASSPPSVADSLMKTCSSPTAASAVRPSCKSLLTGTPAQLSRSISHRSKRSP